MSNEFNTKNGLRIQYSQPVSGITNNGIYNDVNSLATSHAIYVELTGKTNNSDFNVYTASTSDNFVNTSGDTMTGTLYGPAISASTISGSTIFATNIFGSISATSVTTPAKVILTGTTQEMVNSQLDNVLNNKVTVAVTASGGSYTLINNKLNVMSIAKLAAGTHTFTFPVPIDGKTNETQVIFSTDSTLPTIAFAYQGSPYPTTLQGTIPTWAINKIYRFIIVQEKDYNDVWKATIYVAPAI